MAKKHKEDLSVIPNANLVVGEDIFIDTDELMPYENNPRKINDEAVNAVAESIRQYGFDQRIVVWNGLPHGRPSKNEVVVGHARLLAAKKLGFKKVPCTRVDWLTEEQVIAYRIIDNKSGEKSIWDFEKLQIELSKIDMDSNKIELQFSPIELDTIMHSEWMTQSNHSEEEKEEKEVVKESKKILLTNSQYLIVSAAVNKLKEHSEEDLTEGQALASICSDWMNI